jgi:hypothetical protein
VNRPYAVENASERRRLQTLIANLSDEDLHCLLANGWTVAITLAHLAFWDQRQLALVKKWERDGVQAAPADADTINEAVRILAAALPPHTAAQLALEAAQAIDHELEQISADLVAAIEASGHSWLLRRALHRREHLDRIEQTLSVKPDTE